METKSVIAERQPYGGVKCKITVCFHDGRKDRAYDIRQPRDSEGVRHPYYMVDGKRHDLKPNEIKEMKQAIKEALTK